MLEVFIANKNYSSWSLRPWVLLKELGIPFEERLIPFKGERWGEVLAVSPTGRVPALRDGALVVWDSLAIAEYVAEAHEAVWPEDRTTRAWARSAAAEMHSSFGTLRERCTMNCGIRVRIDEPPPALLADVARLDALFAEGLDRFGGPFLAGARFTAVDAFFAPVAFRAQTYAVPFAPRSADYLARLRALASMQSWYADALKETWRDPPHEAEARATGTWLEDLRAPAG